MAVIVRETLAQLGRYAARLGSGDVLAVGQWRIVVADDPARPYWLEGRGLVCQIARGKGAGAELRRRIDAHEAALRRNDA